MHRAPFFYYNPNCRAYELSRSNLNDAPTFSITGSHSPVSGCLNNLIAADGLLNAPGFDNHCICNYPIQTSFAMVYMPEVETWSGTTPLTMTVAPSPKPPTPSLQKQPRK